MELPPEIGQARAHYLTDNLDEFYARVKLAATIGWCLTLAVIVLIYRWFGTFEGRIR